MIWDKFNYSFYFEDLKCKANFTDDGGLTCDKYLKREYCTITGKAGKGWDTDTYGYPIQSYLNKDGDSPLVCPQCGCKLGKF